MSDSVLTPDDPVASPAQAAIWLRTGNKPDRFLAYGSVVGPRLVLVHPPRSTERDAGHEHTAERRMPASGSVRTAVGTTVLDGTLVDGAVDGVRHLRAVILDGPLDVPAVSLPWPKPHDRQGLAVFVEALAALADQDPSSPPPAAPERADAPDPLPPDSPMLAPPWCYIFPRCPGCH
jgi:hypothetical protein